MANSTGPGTLVFDPRAYLPYWPETNWTVTKAALVGGHLRVVAVVGFEPATGKGFEQVVFSPAAGSDAAGGRAVYVRLRATDGPVGATATAASFKAAGAPLAYSYYVATYTTAASSSTSPANGASRTGGPARGSSSGGGGSISVTPLADADFYTALFLEQKLWNATFFQPGAGAAAASYRLPGQEGQRQTDLSRGAIVASFSLFIGLTPNYGDGADYWSPDLDRGSSLPFQSLALDQGILDLGLWNLTAQLVGFYFDHYVVMPRGNLTTGNWKSYCPEGFADGLADYGEMQDLFWRTARAVAAHASPQESQAWLDAHVPQAVALANNSYQRRLQAVARDDPAGSVTRGLIWGSPEHDTCTEPDFYYHINAWFLRGELESGKFLRDVCPTHCPQFAAMGQVLLDDAAEYAKDLAASLALTVVALDDDAGDGAAGGDNEDDADAGAGAAGSVATATQLFVPPIARLGAVPFKTMTQDELSSYSNFRYYSELLGADVLSPSLSVALQDFREGASGTVSGITRWSSHLDDMPSSYYLAASLRDDRIQRFHLLLYGHMANYQSRGTFTATEQLPIDPDANGRWRDYLWDYLEGGIDQCVPSLMIPALGTRWSLVYERYDTDTVWVNKGAPRRWFDPVAAPQGFGIDRALVRFGLVSVTTVNTVRRGGGSAAGAAGQDSSATLTFEVPPALVPGTTAAPQFAVRLLSSDPADVLDPASVALHAGTTGACTLAGVDAANGLVFVNVTAGAAAGQTIAFTVTASLVH